MSEESKNKKVEVSDLFVDIYKHFNVVSQVEKMKQLSNRELYLLITLCLDKHSDEDPVVKYNFQEFKDQTMEIYDVQDDKQSTNLDILLLIDETGDKYIETDNIVDSNGNGLPAALTKQEVRDAKINIINE